MTSDSDLNAGESYVDCVRRLTPIILEMEEHHNLVVVAHQAVLRCIFGYLLRRPLEDIPIEKSGKLRWFISELPEETRESVGVRDGGGGQ